MINRRAFFGLAAGAAAASTVKADVLPQKREQIVTKPANMYVDRSGTIRRRLSAIDADLGQITAGNLQNADGSYVIDLDKKQILIR